MKEKTFRVEDLLQRARLSSCRLSSLADAPLPEDGHHQASGDTPLTIREFLAELCQLARRLWLKPAYKTHTEEELERAKILPPKLYEKYKRGEI
jgi:hypothetical protein